MRGKGTASLKRWEQSGITPAYAGKRQVHHKQVTIS